MMGLAEEPLTDTVDGERGELLVDALMRPRGRYVAARASHLSGVPQRTVYHWAKEGVLVPDFPAVRPKLWSYRDLVYLRLLARMRERRVPLDHAAESVRMIRGRLARGDEAAAVVRLVGQSVLLGDERFDAVSGQYVLTHITDLTRPFNLLEPIEGVSARPTWGPDLVAPTRLTSISPQVMAGEPCVAGTRVPTSSLLALVDRRRLTPAKVMALYPQLSEEAVEDGVALERRMRRHAVAA